MIRTMIAAVAVLLLSFPAVAQTWTGAVSGSWASASNWSPAGVPASSQNTQLVFGATANGSMTDDIAGTFALNAMTFNAGDPTYTLGGNPLNFQTSSGGSLPQIVTNSANSVTIGTPLTLTNGLTVNGTGAVNLNGAIGGTGSLTMAGSGTLTLVNASNTYSGGTYVLSGTIVVGSDGNLGTGNVTGAAAGTLAFTGSTLTTKSFAMNGGTITTASTLAFMGGAVSGAYLDGPGMVTTYPPSSSAKFVNVTTSPSVTVNSGSANDQFVHFTNGGAFSVIVGVNSSGLGTTVNFNGFINQGSGSVTIGASSQINVANFQTYGTLTVSPTAGGGGQHTVLKNVGTAPLGFNGGSRTTIGSVSNNNAYLDLNGKNGVVMDGLFINNGFVIDSSNSGMGTWTIIAHYGSLVKGGGFFQNSVQTVPGARFESGIGTASFGTLVLGTGGVSNYIFAIDDATGTAGATPTANGQSSGWGLMSAVRKTLGNVSTPGELTWTATPASPMSIALDTIIGQTNSDTDIGAPMADFDPTQRYVWPAVQWAGNYSGPTDTATLDAATAFDTSGFLNPIAGGFGWQFDGADHTLSLVYTPSAVPEPGTLVLTAAAGLGLLRAARRRHFAFTTRGS